MRRIITANSAEELNSKIKLDESQGWIPVGDHQVVTQAQEYKYRGNRPVRIQYQNEYSITMYHE